MKVNLGASEARQARSDGTWLDFYGELNLGEAFSQVKIRMPDALATWRVYSNSFLKGRDVEGRARVGSWLKFYILVGKKSDLAILSLNQTINTKKLLTLPGPGCGGRDARFKCVVS